LQCCYAILAHDIDSARMTGLKKAEVRACPTKITC
jgi:hypothetical protein